MKRFTLFISDLHLCETRPHINQLFISWLERVASKADALYILGDFFEYWAGDDAIEPSFHDEITHALKTLSSKGVPVYLMHGNRDFLMGDDFAAQASLTIIQDPSLVTMYDQPVLLSHGDALCTDDVEYMQFRDLVRTATWQKEFLSQSVSERKAYIAQAREKSEQQKSVKEAEIMDVNTETIHALLSEYNYPPTLIHGHTHRPKKHVHSFGNHESERWVLGDWYDQGSCIQLYEDGEIELIDIEMSA